MNTSTINQIPTTIIQNKPIYPKRTLLENIKIKFYQNRFLIFGSISFVFQVWFIKNAYIVFPEIDQDEKVYQEIAFVSSIEVADPTTKQVETEGEIKETERIEKQQEIEDPRIASAQNVFLVGATIPIDLTPDIKPEYPLQARQNGIEGVVTLELVISEEGEVLKITPINKPIGYGLEQSAITAFKKKKYQPAIYEGRPITVKVIVPVQFKLN
ncbi:MAG: energy transducer TonB [Candidatus Omnitrophica bacterium]|nr:energy transducer TonB [Candidatus Omnitrophota bacterium]